MKKKARNSKESIKHTKRKTTIDPETVDNLYIESEKQNKSPYKTSKTKDLNENIVNNPAKGIKNIKANKKNPQ